MTMVSDEILAKYTRYMHDIKERVIKGSLDPEEVMAALDPLIGKGVSNKSFALDLLQGKGRFTIPDDYVHENQLQRFGDKTRELGSTAYYNDSLTDKNFSKVSNRLVPGKTYGIKMFPMLKRVSSIDCLAFLKKQNVIFTGAQGATLLQENKPEVFPKGKWVMSFDEQDALYRDAGGGHRVPRVSRGLDGDWEFSLGYFQNGWHSDYDLLCFCDLEEA